MINGPDQIFVKRHQGPSGYHDEVFHDDDHVVRTLTKILDDAVRHPPQARPGRGPAGRPARHRRPPPHRPRRHRPRRPRPGQHPQVHRRRVPDPRRAGRARHARHPGGRLPAGLRAGPAVDRLRRRSRARARPRCSPAARPSSTPACGSSSPRRCSRPTSRCPTWRQHADPARPPGPARGRPAPAGRRLPAHGPRRRHRRRGPRPRGAAAAAHPVVGREGVHHHPRRLGPPGAHPAAVHLPAGRHVQRAADGGAQRLVSEAIDVVVHCSPARRQGRGSPRSSPWRTCRPAPTPRSSPSPSCSPGPTRRRAARRGPATCPSAAARALAEAGYDVRALLDADADRRAVARRPGSSPARPAVGAAPTVPGP